MPLPLLGFCNSLCKNCLANGGVPLSLPGLFDYFDFFVTVFRNGRSWFTENENHINPGRGNPPFNKGT